MSDRVSATEFARLAALPEDHPERRRAADSPEVQARLAMLREFETPSPSPLSDAEATREARVISARVLARLAKIGFVEGRMTLEDMTARRRKAAALTRSRRPWLERGLGPDANRAAIAFAALVIVAGVGWFAMRTPEPRATRGVTPSGGLIIESARLDGGTLTLRWTEVTGAEHYRVIFYGADMRERARLENVSEPTLALVAGTLPAGLESGEQTLVEVTAMKRADPLMTSAPRLIRLP